MNSTSAPIFDPTESAISKVIQTLCIQIIAFQDSISSREPANRFPNLTEVGLLVKLISCLDKLRKFFSRSAADTEMKAFIRFLKESDTSMAKTVAAKYKEYAASKSQEIPPMFAFEDTLPTQAITNGTYASAHTSPTVTTQNTIIPFTEAPGENQYYIPTKVEKVTVPESMNANASFPVIAPLPTEIYNINNAGTKPCDNQPLQVITGDFDHLVTQHDVETNPVSINDYNRYWWAINDPCKATDKILINGIYHKYFVLQYKLRYIHYLLQLAMYEEQNPSVFALCA